MGAENEKALRDVPHDTPAQVRSLMTRSQE
jgi:hypothetical protein